MSHALYSQQSAPSHERDLERKKSVHFKKDSKIERAATGGRTSVLKKSANLNRAASANFSSMDSLITSADDWEFSSPSPNTIKSRSNRTVSFKNSGFQRQNLISRIYDEGLSTILLSRPQDK